MQTRFHSCVGPRVGVWLLVHLTHLHFVRFQPTSLQHYIHALTCHIMWYPIFHSVNVVIPLMIYVLICFGALTGMSIQQPTIHFRILSRLLFQKVEHMFRGRIPTFPSPHPTTSGYPYHHRRFSNLDGHHHY